MYNILIQGPLNKDSLEQISEYQKYGQVVVSCWRDKDKCDLIHKLFHIPNVTVIFTEEPKGTPDEKKVTGKTTFNKAITSQFFGLAACSQPYTIKTRSDEYYNLKPLIEKFEDGNQDKLLFGNIFYKHDMFHIGDHLYMGKTSTLYNAVSKIYKYYQGIEGDQFCETYLREIYRQVLAEHVLCKALLYSMGHVEVSNLVTTYEFIMNNFVLVDINDLGPFQAQYASSGQTYKNSFQSPHAIKDFSELPKS